MTDAARPVPRADGATDARNAGLEAENERLRAANRAAEILIHSLLGTDDEDAQARKLLAWSSAQAAARA